MALIANFFETANVSAFSTFFISWPNCACSCPCSFSRLLNFFFTKIFVCFGYAFAYDDVLGKRIESSSPILSPIYLPFLCARTISFQLKLFLYKPLPKLGYLGIDSIVFLLPRLCQLMRNTFRSTVGM